MRLFAFSVFFVFCSFTVPQAEFSLLGEKIWRNECAGKVEGLLHWHEKEEFPSLGIAHCIWYRENQNESFEETFPSLVEFLQKYHVQLPEWLKSSTAAPWSSRAQFYEEMGKAPMQELRSILVATKDLQVAFLVERLRRALEKMGEERVHADLLGKSAKGRFALLDYANFKGFGLDEKEAYENRGWGLRQVLQAMDASSLDPIQNFINAAKRVLSERVAHAPKERGEERWLAGWHARVERYAD